MTSTEVETDEPAENVDNLSKLQEQEKTLESKINKEIGKLKYYLEETDELIENGDVSELVIAAKRTDEIRDGINDLISRVQELKLDIGNTTQRAIRQWKKDIKASFTSELEQKEKINEFLEGIEKKRNLDLEKEKLNMKFEKEEKFRLELEKREKALWEERLKAEMTMTEKRLEMEAAAKTENTAKLPKLKITPFKGTAEDWIRFENMFTTQIHEKPISAAEKFGYLLELVNPKIRERLANLKPGDLGYKTAWDRLKAEYGKTKTVIAAHVDQIVNLPVVRGSSYVKVHEFYDSLSKSHDALLTLGEENMLKGFVLTALNKLPNIKADLVRVDEEWEEWGMNDLLKAIEKWLKRNQPESGKEMGEKRSERHWFSQKGGQPQRGPHCIFGCEDSHWGDCCPVYDTLERRRRFFSEKHLCFNCGRAGHRESKCRGRGCYKCKARHHTSLCNKEQGHDQQKHDKLLAGFSPSNDEKTLPPIIPIKVKGITLWAYLDTGSGRNFVSKEAIEKLKLTPDRHETRHVLTVNGTKKQSMPVFEVGIESVDGSENQPIELTGSKMEDFTTVKRPTVAELKERYPHMQGKTFYRTATEEYPIHVILGDSVYCQIKTESVLKGKPDDPIVEGTTFGWIVHGGKDYADGRCMFTRETNEYERLYSLDVLGIEDRGEDDQFDVYREFKENITTRCDGRYEVSVPWIPGTELVNTNEEPSRKRLKTIERKLSHDQELRMTYEEIVKDQLEEGIIEPAPVVPTGPRVFYMPHKPVVREKASSSKVRMVFDASARPHPFANSVNECMHTGPPLQPLLWDILIRARMSPHLILADIQKAFLQIGLKEEDRDAFRFLFNVNNQEQHFRFARVPFGAEASPFMLGATVSYHLDQQPSTLESTVRALRENTYVDNLMQIGSDIEELKNFKEEATQVFESAQFPVHKWESDVLELDEELNPSKILGYHWDKREDTFEIQTNAHLPEDDSVTKRTILSKLSAIYDPLGIVSPHLVEGKRIYRETCDDKMGWNTEVSDAVKKDWIKWSSQLRNIKVPRSVARDIRKLDRVHLHVFADASNIACSAVTIAVVESQSGTVKGLLTSKSRISKRNTTIARLELVSGHMAANMVKNLLSALRQFPIASVTIWMDSMVALYWICNPGKSWKVFVSNRVRKIAEITQETGIKWKYCPTYMNLADLGSRGANLDKMDKGEWYSGPDWLLDETKWPAQPKLVTTNSVSEEHKPLPCEIFFTAKRESDEWDALLDKSSYWKTLRVTAWVLRWKYNALAKKRGEKRKRGPLTTEEISIAENHWVRRVQEDVDPDLETPGWKLVKDENTSILKCKGRIRGYEPVFIPNGEFATKLILYVHQQVNHLGVANTMSAIRERWWMPRLRSKVKKVINRCNLCKVFSAKPWGTTATADLPTFRTENGKPFETTGIDFAGPLSYKITKKEQGKCYIIIFTCATSRAVHLEVTKSQTAEEFRRKLNAFITRKTRPKRIVSDNASVFKATATWIKKIRKSEALQDHLAKQDIKWQFNLSRSPWWGGLYERLIKEIKKTLYKTMGRSHLRYEQMEGLVMDIERHLNNRPLTYVESDGEEQVLTPNLIMWGQDSHILEDVEIEGDEVSKLHMRLLQKRQHVWQRWKNEYIHGLMEHHRVHRGVGSVPAIGEVVLLVGDGKNRGEWTKGRVVRYVKGKDGVVRGVTLLHKGHHIERPLSLVCPLEITSSMVINDVKGVDKEPQQLRKRSAREAAKLARVKISLAAEDDDD